VWKGSNVQLPVTQLPERRTFVCGEQPSVNRSLHAKVDADWSVIGQYPVVIGNRYCGIAERGNKAWRESEDLLREGVHRWRQERDDYAYRGQEYGTSRLP